MAPFSLHLLGAAVVALTFLAGFSSAQPYVVEAYYQEDCIGGAEGPVTIYSSDVCYESTRKYTCNSTTVSFFTCLACNCTLSATFPLGQCTQFLPQPAAAYSCITDIDQIEQSYRRPNNETVVRVTTRSEGPECTPGVNSTVYHILEPRKCGPNRKRSVAATLSYDYGYETCNLTSTLLFYCNDSQCNDCVLSEVLPLETCTVSETTYSNKTCLILPALPAPIAPPAAPPVAAPVAAPVAGSPTVAPVSLGSPTASVAPSGSATPTSSAGPTASGNAPTGSTAPSGGNSTAPSVRAPSSASVAVPTLIMSLLASAIAISLLL